MQWGTLISSEKHQFHLIARQKFSPLTHTGYVSHYFEAENPATLPPSICNQVYPPRCSCLGLAPSPEEQANTGTAVTANKTWQAEPQLPLLLHQFSSAARQLCGSCSLPVLHQPLLSSPAPPRRVSVQTWQQSTAGCRAPAPPGERELGRCEP